MRILPASKESDALALGIESGGIHSTEALLLARYFMFMQVYHHHVRVAYDLHLEEFLKARLPEGQFPEDWDQLNSLTDNEILSAIYVPIRQRYMIESSLMIRLGQSPTHALGNSGPTSCGNGRFLRKQAR